MPVYNPMESFLAYICEHALQAPYIIFLLLLLAGFNVPISEDLMLLIGGIIASTCIPEHTLYLYIWIFFGCWLSAWEAYWVGRLLGPKLYTIKWFSHILTPHRIERLHYYYEKFGVLTFIVGRFFPGGVRNALFITSGLGKMPFLKFISRDFVGCLISTSVIFSIGYQFGEYHEKIFHFFKIYNETALILLVAILATIALLIWKSRKNSSD